MVVFKKHGFICNVERDKNELDDQFATRGLFIVSQKPETVKEYNKTILYSRCYINVKYNQCEYAPKMMEILGEMEKNMYQE